MNLTIARPVTAWGPYYDYTGETQVCGTNGTQSGQVFDICVF